MDHFGHFFEFCAAVNSAYIASTSFVDKLSFIFINNKNETENVRSVTNNIGNSASELRQILDEAQVKLERFATTAKVNVKQRVDDLNSTYTKLAAKIDGMGHEYENEIKTKTENPNFHMDCFAGATYSVLMLVLFGFDINFHKVETLSYLFAFNIFIVIFNIYFHYRDVKKKKPIFKLKLILYSGIITVVFIILDCFFNFSYCNYNYYYFNVFISLSVPIYHILIYTYKSWTTVSKVTIDYQDKIEVLKGECKDYFKEIELTEKTVQSLEIKDK